MFDNQKITDANFIISFDTEYTELCDDVIKKFEEILANDKERQVHYMNGSQSNNGFQNRKDESLLFDTCALDYHGKIHDVLAKYTPQYAEQFPSFAMANHTSCITKVQKTVPKGGFHIWHAEHGKELDFVNRTLTWTLYLNDVPEGEGETEFLEYGVKVQPKKGRLCYFPAAWTHTHRGNPVYTTTKYIATGWYQFS
tara:strand:- start:33 stop:623 length:591 start_codon:yes stop_codon:yes gene_type:complete